VRSFKLLTSDEKSIRFFSGVVKGLCHEPASQFLNRLRDHFCAEAVSLGVTFAGQNILEEMPDYSNLYVSDDQVCDRYNVPYDVYKNFCDQLTPVNLRAGMILRHPFVDAVFARDYGLS